MSMKDTYSSFDSNRTLIVWIEIWKKKKNADSFKNFTQEIIFAIIFLILFTLLKHKKKYLAPIFVEIEKNENVSKFWRQFLK
jgi:hypothetical protein